MKILYFAWLKEHTGTSTETMTLPDGVTTVAGLIPHITAKSAGHKTALANMDTVRIAVNRVYGDPSSLITEGDEVAFFPPVTGG
jgi:molybdopterin converting factor subunit 1